MKILYLAHRIPYPPNKGDKIRSFNEIRHLSRSHEIDLVCLADYAPDVLYTAELDKYCANVHVERLVPSRAKVRGAMSMLSGRSFSVGYFYSKILQRVVDEWTTANHYDAVICFSSPMAEYLFRCSNFKDFFPSSRGPCPLHPAPRLVMDFVDVDSDKWRQYASESALPASLIYWAESKLLLKHETRVNRSFEYSVYVSKAEADLFSRLYPEARNVNPISNGVDYDYFSPDGVRPDDQPKAEVRRPMLLFTGAMDYHANIDGVRWFCDEILPLVQKKNPSAELYIVGSNPASQVKRIGRKSGVQVTGFVEDMRPYYRAADVCVIPLRLARGIQNKVLEAMAMGKPVVTTTKALEGIGATPGEHVLVSNDAEGIANAVEDLLKNEEKRKYLGKKARDFVVSHYDWAKSMKGLEGLLIKRNSWSHSEKSSLEFVKKKNPLRDLCDLWRGKRASVR